MLRNDADDTAGPKTLAANGWAVGGETKNEGMEGKFRRNLIIKQIEEVMKWESDCGI
jgi:hypothetical protein